MRKTRRQLVFEALYRAGSRGATTAELAQPDVGGVRFGGRIAELRAEGFRISETYERPGSHRYHLDRSQLQMPPEEPEALTGWKCVVCGCESTGDGAPVDCCPDRVAIRLLAVPRAAEPERSCECQRCETGYPCREAA